MKFFCFLLGALIQLSFAQNPPAAPTNPNRPTVMFHSVWEEVTPQEYDFSVQADGTTSYLSRGAAKPVRADEHRTDKRWQSPSEEKPDTAEEKDPDFHLNFTLSAATAQHIFKDAEQANYFNGSFDYTKHAVANTGRKTLTYADPGRRFQTTFNYSDNNAVDDLARLFMAISNTIESGRKLEFKHKYDKLGLEAELRSMEDAMEIHNLAELQLIALTLQSIAEDNSVLNIARARARHLLKKVNSK